MLPFRLQKKEPYIMLKPTQNEVPATLIENTTVKTFQSIKNKRIEKKGEGCSLKETQPEGENQDAP